MTRSPRTGRPPKPHHLRVIEGNPGGRPMVEPPKPPPSKPTAPAWLSPYAKTTWRRLVPILDAMGILTTADRDTMAGYCEAVANLKNATAIITDKGYLVQGRKGEAVKNPMLQVQREAIRLIASYSAMFGLSPSDRVRLAGTPTGADDLGDIERYLRA